MSFKTFRTVTDIHVRVYKQILQKIIRKHSELEDCEGMIYETIEDPDYIVEGYKHELLAIKHYDITPVGSKEMVVVYHEDKGFVITAFLTSKAHKITEKRRIIWQKAR